MNLAGLEIGWLTDFSLFQFALWFSLLAFCWGLPFSCGLATNYCILTQTENLGGSVSYIMVLQFLLSFDKLDSVDFFYYNGFFLSWDTYYINLASLYNHMTCAWSRFNDFGVDGGPAAKELIPKLAVAKKHISKLLGIAIPDVEVWPLYSLAFYFILSFILTFNVFSFLIL